MKSRVFVLVWVTAGLLAVAALTSVAGLAAQTTSAAVKFGEPFTPLKELRIKPLEESKWTDRHRERLGANLKMPMVAVCAHNLDLCAEWWDLSQQIISKYTLPQRDKELLILRTAFLCNADFVWSQHARLGTERKTFTAEEIAKIAEGPDAKGWTEFEAGLLRAADELHRSQFVKDPTWKTLAQKYTDGQMVEVLFTVGNYHIFAMYHNSIGLQIPAGASRVPR